MALKVTTPEIRWHCGPTGLNEAVLSIDFLHQQQQSSDNSAPTILATGGADKDVKLWRVTKDLQDNGGLDFIFSLSGHDRSVNCVRFSPNGVYLASASDDMSIIIWTKPKTAGDDWGWDKIVSLSDVTRTILPYGHKGDITDLSWSPDSVFLCSTSVDNCSAIWNVEKGDVAERRKDHTQYVQGCAWDPLNEFLVTEGNDRTCRVYALNGYDSISRQSSKKQSRRSTCIQIIKTREFPQEKPTTTIDMPQKKQEGSDAAVSGGGEEPARAPPTHRMFLDDTCPAFARRLTWTPDGKYLLVPTGIFRATESASPVNTVYAFSRGNFSQPTLHLPGQEKASLAIRCSPILYELRRNEGETPCNFFQTPYRSIFAVITLNTVVIYDTQQSHPICTLKNLHYADLTDVSWSADGLVLSISSIDGYLSFVQFEEGFFGIALTRQNQIAMNEAQIKRMLTTPKPTRKKQKTQSTTDEQAVAPSPKTPVVKKKSSTTPSLVRAFQQAKKTEGTSNAGIIATAPQAVTVLQVRKKRKITPVLVQPANGHAISGSSHVVVAEEKRLAGSNVIDLSMESEEKSEQPNLPTGIPSIDKKSNRSEI